LNEDADDPVSGGQSLAMLEAEVRRRRQTALEKININFMEMLIYLIFYFKLI
jgi:hypothetical protein